MSQNRNTPPSRSPKPGNGAKKDSTRKTFHTSARRADDRPQGARPQSKVRPRTESRQDQPPRPERSAGSSSARSKSVGPRNLANSPVDSSLPGFEGFGLDAKLLRGVAAMGFTEPTPIQSMGVPPAVAGRDVLACAMTGSGKTASFLLPVLQRLLTTPAGHGRAVRALALTPTRELAAQIVEQFNELGKFTNLRAVAVYGGVGMGPQEQAFRRGVDLMVACPGRLLDHLSRSYADLQDLEVLVLDEVDRMLDMGFLPDVKRILQQIPGVEQTLCYSATMPRDIVDLTDSLQNNAVKLQVERESKPAEGIRQTVFPVHEGNKRDLLVELLKGPAIFNALVFTRTKHRANRLADYLGKAGVIAERIHGNRSQAQRTRALDQFKKGKARVLVATDVAARGIDVEDLSHVINFDIPNVPDDYIHRVGRTARAERTGDAFSFVTQQEESYLRSIERVLGEKLPRKMPDGSVTLSSKEPSDSADWDARPARAAQPARKASQAQPGDSGQGNGPRKHSHRPQHSTQGRKQGSGYPKRGEAGSSRGRSRGRAS